MYPIIEHQLSNLIIAGVLALLVLGLTRVWRSPQLAHALWLLVLLKLVIPPFVDVPSPIPTSLGNADTTPPMAGLVEAATGSERAPGATPGIPAATSGEDGLVRLDEPAATEGTVSWQSLLLAVWAAGVFVFAFRTWRRHRALKGILKTSRPASRALEEEAAGMADKLGLRSRPSIRVSDSPIGPCVTIHPGKQVVLLPASLLDGLDRDQRKTVLAHELAHVRRGDRWVNLFRLAVLGVHWWNPVAWWASCRLKQAAEECCDAMVIWNLPENRRSYGNALLRTVEFLTENDWPAAPAGDAFGGPPLRRRIENIMRKQTQHQMTAAARVFTLSLGLAVLPIATTANPSAPAPPETTTSPPPPLGGTPAIEAVKGNAIETPGRAVPQTEQERAARRHLRGLDLEEAEVRLSIARDKLSSADERMRANEASKTEWMEAQHEAELAELSFKRAKMTADLWVEVDKREVEEAKRAARTIRAKRRFLELDRAEAQIRFELAHDDYDRISETPDADQAALSAARKEHALARLSLQRAEAALELFDAETAD